MTFEEAEQLDKYSDISNRAAWRLIWARSRMLLPLTAFSALCMIEMVTVNAWALNVSRIDFFARLALGMAMVLSPNVLLVFTSLRFRKRPRAKIEIKTEGIETFSKRAGLLSWERTTSLRMFTGLADDLAIFRVKYRRKPSTSIWNKEIQWPPGKKAFVDESQLPSFTMRLTYPEQSILLRQKLIRLRAEGKPVPSLVMHFNRHGQWRWAWLAVLGMFLFAIHGLPLLLAAGISSGGSSRNDPQDSARVAAIAEKLGPFIIKHFQTTEQLKRFGLVCGGVLTFFGVAFCSIGLVMLRKTKDRNVTVDDDGSDASNPSFHRR